jgi:hypothetical protein
MHSSSIHICNLRIPGKLVGIIVPLNDGAVEYAMCSDVLAIGR